MKINRSAYSLVVAASVALAALGVSGAAQADNVYWSVGVSSPGVQVGVANGRPMVVAQPMYQPSYEPVYTAPYPVYVAPRPMVYVQPAPVYVAPPQYVQVEERYPGYWRGGWRHGHGRYEQERFGPGRFDGEHSGHCHDHGRD